MKSFFHIFLIPVVMLLGSCTTSPAEHFRINQNDRIYVYDSRTQIYYECPFIKGIRFEKAPDIPTIPKYLLGNHDAVTDILVKSLEEHRLAMRRDREQANQYLIDYIESCKR